jgi:N12 class adenine-specific DNA methylase
MERVSGIQTGGSERAFDLYMKARYLHQQHPGHGVTFATGTPISNTMCEMYTMQRYLDPEGLRERGIDHFDGWAATFGEVVDTMEISPDGASLRPRSRFAKFTNLPELQQMFRAYGKLVAGATVTWSRLETSAFACGKPHGRKSYPRQVSRGVHGNLVAAPTENCGSRRGKLVAQTYI